MKILIVLHPLSSSNAYMCMLRLEKLITVKSLGKMMNTGPYTKRGFERLFYALAKSLQKLSNHYWLISFLICCCVQHPVLEYVAMLGHIVCSMS